MIALVYTILGIALFFGTINLVILYILSSKLLDGYPILLKLKAAFTVFHYTHFLPIGTIRCLNALKDVNSGDVPDTLKTPKLTQALSGKLVTETPFFPKGEQYQEKGGSVKGLIDGFHQNAIETMYHIYDKNGADENSVWWLLLPEHAKSRSKLKEPSPAQLKITKDAFVQSLDVETYEEISPFTIRVLSVAMIDANLQTLFPSTDAFFNDVGHLFDKR